MVTLIDHSIIYLFCYNFYVLIVTYLITTFCWTVYLPAFHYLICPTFKKIFLNFANKIISHLLVIAVLNVKKIKPGIDPAKLK